MSADSAPEERTEDPTAKRMEKLRSEGTLAMSSELATLAALLAGFILIKSFATYIYAGLETIFIRSVQRMGDHEAITVDQLT